MFNITSGRLPGAKKIVIYGPEGIGKSTLASQFPDPVFIDTEDSTKDMDVKRLPKPSSWTMLLDEIRYVRDTPGICGTLVLDTADWAEQMEIDELLKQNQKNSINDFGYGNGYTYSAERFGKMLNLMSEVANKEINIVITAHAQLRKVELPEEMGAYDHWEMKTSKKVAPLIREWADAVLFLNYKVNVINIDNQGAAKGKNKAQGGRRVIHTNHAPFWDAKNRYGMPDELPLEYASIAPIFEGGAAPAASRQRDDSRKAAPAQPKTVEKKSSGKTSKAPSVPDPEPAKEVDKNLQGFTAQEDLYFKMKDQLFHIKPGNLVPGELVSGNYQITKEEYDRSGPTPIMGPEDVDSVSVDDYTEPDPRIPKSLRDLMIADRIDEWEIQNIASSKGYMTADTRVYDYPKDFLDGWCVGYWPQLKAAIMDVRKKQEIEYK